ncbi:MAG TPA: hypothetical protein VFG95_02090 [Nitrospiria bacterium]|nr:hypothetical protein [Nitrospiria bacterium]
MRSLIKSTAIGILLVLLCGRAVPAMTDIMRGAEIQGDPKAVKAILATFDRAEEALQKKNLSEMMSIYSKNYRNRGLGREDTSRIWKDIFSRYDRLSSRHLFSKVIVDEKKKVAQLTCTGALFGVPVMRREGAAKPVQVDYWFEAVHHLVLEDGRWKIIGHDPAGGEEGLFESAIHLLF